MKKYLFIAVAMLGSVTIVNAQTVTKRVVEKTNKGDSKTHSIIYYWMPSITAMQHTPDMKNWCKMYGIKKRMLTSLKTE